MFAWSFVLGKVAGEVTELQSALQIAVKEPDQGSFSFFNWPFIGFDKYFSLPCLNQGQLSELLCRCSSQMDDT